MHLSKNVSCLISSSQQNYMFNGFTVDTRMKLIMSVFINAAPDLLGLVRNQNRAKKSKYLI